jgi:hypothetical protein
MKRHGKLLKIMAWSAVGLSLLLAVVVLMGSALFEARDVGRGSLLYRLGAPGYLQSVRTMEECREPIYRWKGRDGESNPYTSLSYGSRKPQQELLQAYREAFEKQSCTARPVIRGGHLGFDCAHADFVSVDVSVSGADQCQDITIDFVENY